MTKSKMSLFLVLLTMLTSQIPITAWAVDLDILLQPGMPAPFEGALVPRPNYETYVASKKKLLVCHQALNQCQKSIQFPEVIGPVRDGIILGASVMTILLVIAYSLGHR